MKILNSNYFAKTLVLFWQQKMDFYFYLIAKSKNVGQPPCCLPEFDSRLIPHAR
jgi:hypothetical protein